MANAGVARAGVAKPVCRFFGGTACGGTKTRKGRALARARGSAHWQKHEKGKLGEGFLRFDRSTICASAASICVGLGFLIPVTLRHNIVDHIAGDIGEAEIAAAVTVGELLVIDAHQIQNSRVDIVHLDGLFLGFEAKVIG